MDLLQEIKDKQYIIFPVLLLLVAYAWFTLPAETPIYNDGSTYSAPGFSAFSTISVAGINLITGEPKLWPYSSTETVTACGDRIYINYGNVLRAYDITDKENPIIVQDIRGIGVPISGGPQTGQYISCNDKVVVVPKGSGGTKVVNALTFEVITLPDSTTFTAIDGNTLYTAGGGSVRSIDITNPSAPALIATTQISSSGLAASNGNVYVNKYSGVDILDRNLNTLSNYPSPGDQKVYDLYAKDSILAISYYSPGDHVELVDVSNPSNPTQLSTYSGYRGEVYKKVALAGNYLIVGKHDTHINIVDISDPSNPVEKSIYSYTNTVGGYPRDISAIDDNHFVLASSYTGGAVVQIEPLTHLAKFETIGRSKGADYEDGYAYSLEDFGMRIIDFNLDIPEEISYIEYRARGSTMFVENEMAYISASWGGLKFIDVSDKWNPKMVWDWNPAEYTTGLHKSGDILYVSTSGYGSIKPYVGLFNVSVPSAPVLISKAESDREMHNMAFLGNYMYVTAGRTAGVGIIFIYDLTDKTNPQPIGNITGIFPRALSFTEDKKYMLVGDYYYGVRFYDMTNPIQPVLASGYASRHGYNPAGGGIKVFGDTMLVSAPYYGKQVQVDITDPLHPIRVGEFTAPGGMGVHRDEGKVVFSIESQGIAVYDLGIDLPPVTSTTLPQNKCSPMGACQGTLECKVQTGGYLDWSWSSNCDSVSTTLPPITTTTTQPGVTTTLPQATTTTIPEPGGNTTTSTAVLITVLALLLPIILVKAFKKT